MSAQGATNPFLVKAGRQCQVASAAVREAADLLPDAVRGPLAAVLALLFAGAGLLGYLDGGGSGVLLMLLAVGMGFGTVLLLSAAGALAFLPAEDEDLGDVDRGGSSPPRCWTASRAQLTMHEAHSLLRAESKGASAGGLRTRMLAAAHGLGEGERAMLVVSYAADPEYADRAETYRRQLAFTGSTGGGEGWSKALFFLLRITALLAAVSMWLCLWVCDCCVRLWRGRRGSYRWRRHVKPMFAVAGIQGPGSSSQDEEKLVQTKTLSKAAQARLSDVESKLDTASQGPYWQASAYLVVAGAPQYRDALGRTREAMETALGDDFSGSAGQCLQWRECDPAQALAGQLDPRGGGHGDLGLSTSELAALTSGLDGSVEPQGVTVQRRTMRERLPTRQLTLEHHPESLLVRHGGQDLGALPLGTIHTGSLREEMVGVANANLDRHWFLAGGSGSGKSELLLNSIIAAAKDPMRPCLIVLDPHGQLADDVVRAMPEHCPERVADVVVADFGDVDWPVAFNPLDVRSRNEIEARGAQLRALMDTELDMGGAVRAVVFAENALLAMMEANLSLPAQAKSTLLQILDFFTKEEYRLAIMERCTNPGARYYFGGEGSYELMDDKQRREMIVAIERAFNVFARSRSFARSTGASSNLLNLDRIIGERSILLIKTGAGGAGKRLARLLTQLTIQGTFALAPKHGRRSPQQNPETDPWVRIRIFADETEELLKGMSPELLTDILTQARKYDLGLIGGAQYLDQLDGALQSAFLSNASTLTMLWNQSPQAVKRLADALGSAQDPVAPAEASGLREQGYGVIASTILPDGKATGAFSAQLPAPLRRTDQPELAEDVAARSHLDLCNSANEMDSRLLTHTDVVMAALIELDLAAEAVIQDEATNRQVRSEATRTEEEEVEEAIKDPINPAASIVPIPPDPRPGAYPGPGPVPRPEEPVPAVVSADDPDDFFA